jgi:hypothetical protein
MPFAAQGKNHGYQTFTDASAAVHRCFAMFLGSSPPFANPDEYDLNHAFSGSEYDSDGEHALSFPRKRHVQPSFSCSKLSFLEPSAFSPEYGMCALRIYPIFTSSVCNSIYIILQSSARAFK